MPGVAFDLELWTKVSHKVDKSCCGKKKSGVSSV